jgi:SNF2 family DNA or RNA helicase
MLCDEVGLGKTIEAGLVLSELSLRGVARSVLILVPPSLIEQWQGEMRRKFGLEFISHDHPDFRQAGADAWQAHDPRHRLVSHGQTRAAPFGHSQAALGPGDRG